MIASRQAHDMPWRAAVAPGRDAATTVHGFTLLEVMISLAILALALTVIAQAQQLSMRQVTRSKWITRATLLAREKMIDVEDTLFEEGTSHFDEEEEGDFGDEGAKEFGYKLKVDKIEIPQALDAEAMQDAISGGGAEGSSGGSDATESAAGSMASGIGASMIGQQMEIFRKVLEESIRRVTLEVSWKEGRTTRSIRIVGYFTDPRKVDQAAGGALLSSALSGAAGTSTTTTGATGATTGSQAASK